MLRKRLSFVFALLVSHLMFLMTLPVNAQTNKNAQRAEKIKAHLTAIGVGQRVSVKLRAGGDLVGYVSQIDENDFVIVKPKPGTKHVIVYADVEQVKRKKEKDFSIVRGALTGVGILVIIGVVVRNGIGT